MGNKITSIDYGLAIRGSFSDPSMNGVVINNMIQSNDEALYIRNASLVQVYHNTLLGNRAFYLDNQSNIDTRNNIMVTANGTCFYTTDQVSMVGMDYNLYHVTGSGNTVRYGATTYVTLADWQAASFGYGLNSVAGNPSFVNGLHVSSALPVDAGDPTLSFPVLVDFDGEMRPMGANPDIGADEHVVVANDAMAVALIAPNTCGNLSTDVIVSIANLGYDSLFNTPITVNVTGATTTSFNFVQALVAEASMAEINVGVLNTNAGGVFNFEIIVSSSTDSNSSNDTLRTSVTINPSNQIALSMVGDTMVCDSSTAIIAALASYNPSTILWYDAAIGGNLVHVGDLFTTGNISTTTMYYAEVQGCTSPRAVATVEIDTQGIQVDLGADQAICSGVVRLTPILTSSVATSFIWSNGSQSTFLEVATPALYAVTATNASGCTDTDTVEVRLFIPTVTNITNNVSCGGGSDGVVDLTGSGFYTYLWSTSQTTEDITGLSSGFYSVTINDSRMANCTNVMSYLVAEPATLSANVDLVGLACNGNDGSIDITVTGGFPNYTYNWSTSATTEDLINTPVGTHTVSITDANGCETTATGTITAATPIVIVIDTVYAEILAISGGISITATGGTGNLQYVWNTGATTSNLTGLVAGSYDVTVTDLTTGCQEAITGIIVPYQLPDFVNAIPSLDVFKLYPNPTRGRVFVNIVLTETTEVQLEVMTMTGQVVQSFAPRENLEQNYEINTTDYPSGVYLAKFVIANKVITEKIIVE